MKERKNVATGAGERRSRVVSLLLLPRRARRPLLVLQLSACFFLVLRTVTRLYISYTRSWSCFSSRFSTGVSDERTVERLVRPAAVSCGSSTGKISRWSDTSGRLSSRDVFPLQEQTVEGFLPAGTGTHILEPFYSRLLRSLSSTQIEATIDSMNCFLSVCLRNPIDPNHRIALSLALRHLPPGASHAWIW
jgi:hypothetical protein